MKYSEIFENLMEKVDFLEEESKKYYQGFGYKKKEEGEKLEDEEVCEYLVNTVKRAEEKLKELYAEDNNEEYDEEYDEDEIEDDYSDCDISENEENAFDVVNKPKHYNSGKIEVIDYIEDVTSQIKNGFEGYCIGNALKYISRQHLKNGLEDVKKSAWYINRLIEYKEKQNA